MTSREKSELMALRIYGSNLFGVYGSGNFDLSLDQFTELLYISMQGNEEDNPSVIQYIEEYYNEIK